jgi:NitT/TauT family transport system permease protein
LGLNYLMNNSIINKKGLALLLSQKNLKTIWVIFGVILIFLSWALLHQYTNDLVVASPVATMIKFCQEIVAVGFWENVIVTLKRFIIGLLLGVLLGIISGVLAGFYRPIKYIFAPIRWVVTTIPPIMLIMLSMIIFGDDEQQCIFVMIIVVGPILYINTVEGLEAIDRKLVEVGKVYNLSLMQMWRDIYFPGIFSYINAALVMCAGLGIRIIILAEVLSAHNGIGYEFAMAKLNLEVTRIYSWMLASLMIVGLIEFGVLLPLKHFSGKR